MTTQYSHLTAHKFYGKLFPEKKTVVISKKLFADVKDNQGHTVLSPTKIETDKFIYEVK